MKTYKVTQLNSRGKPTGRPTIVDADSPHVAIRRALIHNNGSDVFFLFKGAATLVKRLT